MDYSETVELVRHESWEAFFARFTPARQERLILLSTASSVPYTDFAYAPGDTLLLGRESAGVPPEIHSAVHARVRIPMAAGLRSLNMVMAGAIVLAEALRQQGQFTGRLAL